MPTQDVIWTVLPNGLSREQGRLTACVSIFISPRLITTGPGTLQAFAAFLDWPDHLRSRNFALQTGAGREIPVRVVTDPTPDSGMWKALFTVETFVRSYQPDELPGHYVSYPASELNRSLASGYAELLNQSHYRPSSDATLGALLGRFGEESGKFGEESGK